MAQGVMNALVQDSPDGHLITRIDSAGTGAYHIGADPDPRTMSTLHKHNINLSHAARQIQEKDYYDFDYILAMDRANLVDIQRRKPPGSKARISLFGEFSVDRKLNKTIKDPYYGQNNAGFDAAYDQCQDFGNGLLEHIRREA